MAVQPSRRVERPIVQVSYYFCCIALAPAIAVATPYSICLPEQRRGQVWIDQGSAWCGLQRSMSNDCSHWGSREDCGQTLRSAYLHHQVDPLISNVSFREVSLFRWFLGGCYRDLVSVRTSAQNQHLECRPTWRFDLYSRYRVYQHLRNLHLGLDNQGLRPFLIAQSLASPLISC